ncbi:MAG: hypothetical protein MUO53_18250 [Maribacter sp.]|nr:hypothetical protein [Maribacter sp.]
MANVTGLVVRSFMALAAAAALRPEAQVFPLAMANVALLELKERHIRVVKVFTRSQFEAGCQF